MFNFFKKAAPKQPAAPSAIDTPEQAVRIHIKLSDENMGTDAEREGIFEFENHVAEAVEAIGGEFDGNEFGGGYGVLYIYGPDAGKLVDAIRPVLAKHPLPAQSYVIQRAGEPGTPEEKIGL